MLRTPPPAAFNTYFLVVPPLRDSSIRMNLLGLQVTSSYASARWLQLFSASAIPTDTSVPLMSIRVLANATNIPVQLPINGLPVAEPGLTIVASSTEGTLTKDVSATMDIIALVEDWEPFTPTNPTDTSVGDLTTSVTSLQVWAEASGPKRLKRITCIGAGSDKYLTAYTVDSPISASRLVWSILIPGGKELDLYFGRGGFSPIDARTDGSHVGLTIFVADNTTPGNQSASTMKIRASYE